MGLYQLPAPRQAADPDASAAQAAAAGGTSGVYIAAERFLLATATVGVALPVVFAATASSAVDRIAVATGGLAIVFASMAIGGLVGLLFGIPTSLQAHRTPPPPAEDKEATVYRSPWVANTSLEQISDWLTKILVGVGLTQLAAIPPGLASVGDYLAGVLGGLPGSEVFATVLFLFALLNGFFLGYLWTRLRLQGLFSAMDLPTLTKAALDEASNVALSEAAKSLPAATPEAPVAAGPIIPGAAPGATTGRVEPLRGLWVDDNPSNNLREQQSFAQLRGIRFDLARDTEEAMRKLTDPANRYAVVITDMGRPGDRTAGYTLIRRMQQSGIKVPTIIYAASASPERDQEARSVGAIGMTSNPTRLLQLVDEALAGET